MTSEVVTLIPACRLSLAATPIEIGPCSLSRRPLRIAEFGSAQAGASQIRALEIGVSQVGIRQVGVRGARIP